MKKKIGMPGWVLDGKAFGVGLAYAEYIRKFGTLVILSPDDPIKENLDLLILPGGADVSPHQHENSNLSLYTQHSNPFLEYFDNTQLSNYIDNGTPILGICRGAQKLWSMFGGKIIQHNIDHKQSSYNKDECHGLSFVKRYEHFNAQVNNVTSRHHQIMSPENKPYHLDIVAYAKEDKKVRQDIVEVFKVDNRHIAGVQYHPEDNPTDLFTPLIINNLLKQRNP